MNTATPPAGITAAGVNYAVVNNNGSNLPNAFKPCTITVSVTDLKLYLCRAHVTNAHVPRSTI